ncbi:methyltransferase domain-containing protein [Paraburkholderia bonniea]|uniref:rhamnosyltransferase WsaF family glycosyltransferase n=1 Tax=Paraburkholderia bonniea TaxID=2152891 RepID=UPI001290BB62|nr:methyltransferase domain-containing protein [Paraburkholderia bonniea]
MNQFTGERIVSDAAHCEPTFAGKMYQEHLARYVFASQWTGGKSVLDVGCGVGYGSHWLAEAGAKQVVAFDLSAEAIAQAKTVYAHPNVRFDVAAADSFQFAEQFDVVTCFELIQHVAEPAAVIQRIHRALKDDGVLLLSMSRALEPKHSQSDTPAFSLDTLRKLLEQRFPEVQFFFTNNHFSSLISDHPPQVLEHALRLKEPCELQQASYLIAVALKSSSAGSVQTTAQTTAQSGVLPNNGAYVKRFEHGVDVLKKMQSDSRAASGARQDDLLPRPEVFTASLAEAHQKLLATDEHILQLSKSLEKLARDLGSEQQLVPLAHKRAVASGFAGSDISTRLLLQELQDLRREFEWERSEAGYVADVLKQVQASRSWRLTAPYRAVGRRFKYPLRVGRRALEYWHQHGTRALLGALKRRLDARGHAGGSGQSVQYAQTQPLASLLTNQKFDVVMAIGCWEGESKRYRVYNIAEGLRDLGYQVHVMPFSDLAEIARCNVKSRVVVLFRAPFEAHGTDEFLRYANVRGIKVVFDVDDLVFDPSIIGQIDGFRLLSPAEQAQYIEGVHQYRELLLRADLVTLPTDYLRQQVALLGKEAMLIPNSLNTEQLRIAEELAQQVVTPRECVRIGYFSGSRTHQKDFAQCADALFATMEAHPETVLRIVGYLGLEERWSQFGKRIERFDFQPYQVMLQVLQEVDINLAPLDITSPFCHGKSELKYFEAGLLGVPTIASSTDTFERAIEHGVSGYCVSTPAQWRESLESLVTSPALRAQIGQEAHKRALEQYSINQVARQAAQVYGLSEPETSGISKVPSPALLPGRLRISWVIPGLIIGGGGHRNILRAAYFLSQFGHQITLYFVGTEQDPHTLKELINKHFYPLDCPVYLFNGMIHPADVVFATHWSTVSAALKGRDVVKEIMYFVQDFEPAFAPMSTEYVLAENTYRLGLYHITSGPWCEVLLKRDYGAQADHFRFPVDRDVYYPRARTYARKNVVFFAKPEMPRRCFELGVMALREFHRLCPEVEIIMFGSKNASKQNYDFPITFREVLPTLDDLAQMYSNGDVGVAFSTTNPSLIPYEMMACGLPVVDLARGDNEVNYGGRQDIALLANPLPEKMALDLAALLANPDELARRREAGLAFVGQFPSEEEMARRIESLVLARVAPEVVPESSSPAAAA